MRSLMEEGLLPVETTYVDDGLDDGDNAVHDGHEAAGDRVDHGVELRRC